MICLIWSGQASACPVPTTSFIESKNCTFDLPSFNASGVEVLSHGVGEQRTIDQQIAAVEEAEEGIVSPRWDFGFRQLHLATVFEVDLELLSHGCRHVAAVDDQCA